MISILVLIPFVLTIIGLVIVIYTLKSVRDLPNTEHNDDHLVEIQVARYEDKAYWIINDQLFRADMTEDGEIDQETAEAVDSMTIDFDEMPLLFNIVEALKEHGA